MHHSFAGPPRRAGREPAKERSDCANSDLAPRRAGREPAKEQSMLLPHAPEQITEHKTEIHPSDTQAISFLAPARWHQFDLTAQHQNFYLAHNQYVIKSRHAR